MVATTLFQDSKAQRMASLADMPPVTFHALGELSIQVAAYCRRLLLFFMPSKSEEVVLPSILDLSGFFGCSERDVLSGLQELQHQGFEYELHGLDDPVRLWNPRTGATRRAADWQSLSRDMLRPWDSAFRSRARGRAAEDLARRQV